MVELGFHLVCEKSKGRRTMMITDGLKDCSSTTGVAREPRILADDNCSFFLLHGLPLSLGLGHHHGTLVHN